MAIKPTIYKFRISLSDFNRDYYDNVNLTIALHPSETTERMMARVLAFCINAREGLEFTRGLSSVEEPDIWQRNMDEKIAIWIDVGEPSLDRIKKATRVASEVKVYSFNAPAKSDVWWEKSRSKLERLNASIVKINWSEIQTLATMLERTMDITLTISGESAFVATPKGECDVSWISLQEASDH